eukprot:CAMPEP_0177736816 /NCGR_PEP_ID=MMETSP0484_2-20121128/25548_1 /TAXON_ID=354590 /ORGANISM="Rhodomonas lens, Strain RHODO" /LENGTH=136 /DNA_ID=CAMNT_0019250545 /DNA_START=35 /DNA_END=445 /DNA_ORIENTATION=+
MSINLGDLETEAQRQVQSAKCKVQTAPGSRGVDEDVGDGAGAVVVHGGEGAQVANLEPEARTHQQLEHFLQVHEHPACHRLRVLLPKLAHLEVRAVNVGVDCPSELQDVSPSLSLSLQGSLDSRLHGCGALQVNRR